MSKSLLPEEKGECLMPIIIYSLENCPRCEEIKGKLSASGYEYVERDMSTAENLTELRVNGCFAQEAPVVRIDECFYEYCDCIADGFFTEQFHVKNKQHEHVDYPAKRGKMGEV